MNDFVKKAKPIELQNKIPDVSSLATKTALTAVENKLPSVSNLVKKTDYNAKITEIEKKLTDHNYDKYVTTPEFHTLPADVFNARLARANLVTKTNIDNSVSVLHNEIEKNKTKTESIENELKKLKKLIQDVLLAKVISRGWYTKLFSISTTNQIF